jgi:hypothetical protein
MFANLNGKEMELDCCNIRGKGGGGGSFGLGMDKSSLSH